MKKKAQVTFFIIIGLLIVAVIASLLIISLPNSPTRIPASFGAIEVLTVSCIEDSLRDAINDAALYGGHAEMAQYFKDFDIDSLAYFTDSPLTFTQDNKAIPYWVYYKKNGCLNDGFCTLKPELYGNFKQKTFSYENNDKSVEAQLSRVTSASAITCVKQTIEQNEEFTASTLNLPMKIMIKEDAIYYEGRLLGSISNKDSTVNTISVSGSFDSTFKELFDAASALASVERHSGFSGNMIIDIISLESSSRGKYPPFWSLDLTYQTNYWTSNSIQKELKKDMDLYFSYVRLTDSDYINIAHNTEIPYVLKRSIIDLRKINSGVPLGNNMMLTYIPSSTEPQVKFSGKSYLRGESLVPQLNLIASLIPMRTYRAYYDIKAPVIFSLQSKKDGLNFRIAVESLIESNIPKHKNSITIISSDENEQVDISLYSAYCNNPSGTELIVNVFGNNNVITEGSLLFSCESSSCTYNIVNEPIRVPACLNAKITVSADDLYFNTDEINTFDSTLQRSLVFEGFSAKPIGLRVSYLSLNLLDRNPYYNIGAPKDIGPHESAIIQFNNLDNDFSQTAMVSSSLVNTQVQLIPGNYEIDITVIRNLNDRIVKIPNREGCGIGWPGTILCIGAYEIDEINFNSSLLLSTISYGSNNQLYLNENNFDTNSFINIIVPVMDLESVSEDKRRIEHLGLLSDLDQIMITHGIMEVIT
jgi:hypothetical protein